MTGHPPSLRLSEYLDGDLPPLARREVERHLDTCAECAATLAELGRVVARAQALEDRPPRSDLWPEVAAAIGAAPGRPRGLRVSLTVPQLLAAGIALALVSAGGAWFATARSAGARAATALQAAPGGPVRSAVSSGAERGYDRAVAALERMLAEHRGRLDRTTVRVVEEKLRLIDRALFEAGRALAADPANPYLHQHLTETRLRKLQLLRRAAELARAAS
ncbi:MAG TPA: zf-HC2 domain-containing protein [Gemmatimonadales bacterium]|nr:zf-HC2 domain-containing protein [Gemmatimonadales bacterium]